MSEQKQKRDFYSGIPWVYVTSDQAHAHPMGKPGLVIWLISAYFVGTAIFKFYVALSFDSGVFGAVLNSIWPLLAGIGLALRVPWSVVMAMISAVLLIYSLLRGSGSGEGDFVMMLLTIANIGILFYLLDSDRANLIYRHRYRKYSVDRDTDEALK